jgi:hypothetical protein
MEDKISAVRVFLIQRARMKGLTNYTEAGAVVGLDMASEIGRILIAQILDAINTEEVNQGRPMISALVLYQNEGRPGLGFFTCARGLGRLKDKDEDGFWAREVLAVHDWWASH